MSNTHWFDNCGGFKPTHSVEHVRDGIRMGLIDLQDEYGSTALAHSVYSEWYGGIEELLRSGANAELRYFRTGATPLYEAVLRKNKRIVSMLIERGANPDAPNYWGITPRRWMPEAFANVPFRAEPHPAPHIQNTEHLADHHENFEIPSLRERVSLLRGQAIDLVVYGPKGGPKQDRVKVRITDRKGSGRETRYTAHVETPLDLTHLTENMNQIEFGPENVATVYVLRPST